MTFSLIIPCYNERANIQSLLVRLNTLLAQILPGDYELLVVDDNSPDGTADLVEEVMKTLPQVSLLRRKDERGLATAIIAGWKKASGELLGVIDADLQHPPELVVELLAALRAGADLAVASRHVTGGGVSDWNPTRRVLSRGAQILAALFTPAARMVSDPMSGFFIVRAASVNLSSLNPLGYKILLEVLRRGSFRKIAEVPYIFQERKHGGSKVTWRQYAEFLVHIWRLRS